MKVFERNKTFTFRYPDEMEKILNYLNTIGKIFVSPEKIEDLYEYFSDEKYCASWMTVNDKLLEQFADWLEGFD